MAKRYVDADSIVTPNWRRRQPFYGVPVEVSDKVADFLDYWQAHKNEMYDLLEDIKDKQITAEKFEELVLAQMKGMKGKLATVERNERRRKADGTE